MRHFAVCPACENPIRIVGLYKELPHTARPYARHTGRPVAGFTHFDPAAHQWCPYVRRRPHSKTSRKTKLAGLPLRVLQTLSSEFDRIVRLLEKDCGIGIGPALAGNMLRTYLAERGYLYTGATMQNVPWIFAYMSDAQNLFGQRIADSSIQAAIEASVPAVVFDERGRLVRGRTYYLVQRCFVAHRITDEDGDILETMTMNLFGGDGKTFFTREIRFDASRFEEPADTSSRAAPRNEDLLDLARTILREHDPGLADMVERASEEAHGTI